MLRRRISTLLPIFLAIFLVGHVFVGVAVAKGKTVVSGMEAVTGHIEALADDMGDGLLVSICETVQPVRVGFLPETSISVILHAQRVYVNNRATGPPSGAPMAPVRRQT